MPPPFSADPSDAEGEEPDVVPDEDAERPHIPDGETPFRTPDPNP